MEKKEPNLPDLEKKFYIVRFLWQVPASSQEYKRIIF